MTDSYTPSNLPLLDSDGHLLLGDLVHCYMDATPSINYPHIVYRPCTNIYIPEAQALPQSSRENSALNQNEMGSWPERLLHVKSMTVYQWQPGNMYGPWREPRYNALCYTWGRYRLPSLPSNIATYSMKFRGVPWDCFPINPKYFTIAQLRVVLQRAVQSDSDSSKDFNGETEFIWIDQACIDQRRSISRDLEARRQGRIMQIAQKVYVWLFSKRKTELQQIWRRLQEAVDNINHPQSLKSLDQCASKTLSSIFDLTSDPWFGSLWTLQEAFCCPDAIILSRNGEEFQAKECLNKPATLRSLYNLCSSLSLACHRHIRDMDQLSKQYTPSIPKLLSWMSILGFSALASGNPIALYNAARYRTVKRDWSHFYAVYQVFDLTSSDDLMNGSVRQVYGQLEEYLGIELLQQKPLLSQFHTYTEPVDYGRGWRFNMSSIVPGIGPGVFSWHTKHESFCNFSPVLIKAKMWGYFTGKICDLQTMMQACEHADSGIINNTSIEFALDIIGSGSMPEDNYGDILDRASLRQGKIAQCLSSYHSNKRLCILLLGQFSDKVRDKPFQGDYRRVDDMKVQNVGLIMVLEALQETRHWHRLGICVWSVWNDNDNAKIAGYKDVEILYGEGPHWKSCSDIFG